MSLADYTPVRATVPLSGGNSLIVRGLGFDDVALLFNQHVPDIGALFERFDNDAERYTLNSVNAIIDLAREAPALVAHMIALASDEPNEAHKARMLPMPVQIAILKEVLRITFEEAGGFRKFVESLSEILRQMVPTTQGTVSPT